MSVMREQAAGNLFLLEDLDDEERTATISEGDLAAMRSIAEWIESYVVKPHQDLIGRPGTVCPFLPTSVERRTLWLAPEQIADRDAAEVVQLMDDYRRVLLDTAPAEGDDVTYNVIAVVFGDLPAERAKGVFDEVQKQLGVPAYVDDGVLFGPYYIGNEVTAIYNPSFRPFESPVPFMFVRHGVISDRKFFLADEEWFGLWARRYGAAGAEALATELRGLPWRNAYASTAAPS